jgi:GAF domain
LTDAPWVTEIAPGLSHAATLDRLRGLLDVAAAVRTGDTLLSVLESVAAAVAGPLGYRAVVINLYRPAWDDFEATAPTSPAGEYDWSRDDVAVYMPEYAPLDEPDAWHPADALLVPLRSASGELLGVVSVDEPISGRRPAQVELELLGAVAAHAAVAVEPARRAAATAPRSSTSCAFRPS